MSTLTISLFILGVLGLMALSFAAGAYTAFGAIPRDIWKTADIRIMELKNGAKPRDAHDNIQFWKAFKSELSNWVTKFHSASHL